LEQVCPEAIQPPAGMVRDLASAVADRELAEAIGHGKVLDRSALRVAGDGPWAIFDEVGSLLAVYEARGQERAQPAVVLAPVG
jgi:hypothetical protein